MHVPRSRLSLVSLSELHADGGVPRVARRVASWLCLRSPLSTPTLRRAYWRLVPALYRRFSRTETDRAAVPPDPFAIYWVDPARIVRFSGRDYPPYRNRWRLFGAVRDGDWDRRSPTDLPVPPGFTLRPLFYADRVTETAFYEAFDAHVHDGVPWSETAFFASLVELTGRDGGSWHGATTDAELLARCAKLDAYYASMLVDGCESQLDRARRDAARWGFLDGLANEIVVDVARDGELLLVSGKHRLTAALLAGVDRVPVAVLVRHADWLDYRDAVALGEREGFDHPDLPVVTPTPAERRTGTRALTPAGR